MPATGDSQLSLARSSAMAVAAMHGDGRREAGDET